MRPVLVILIWVLILGGMSAFMNAHQQPTAPATHVHTPIAAAEPFHLECMLTFDAGPDPFSLDAGEAASLLITLNGREVFRRSDAVTAGDSVRVTQVSGMVVGRNEIYVKAAPQDDSAPVARAARVRIIRGQETLVERTLFAEPGMAVDGTMVVHVPGTGAEGDSDSDNH